MLFWVLVNGLVNHGANCEKNNGEKVEISHRLWKFLHGPQCCDDLIIRKTARAKDYRPEFEKLNHN